MEADARVVLEALLSHEPDLELLEEKLSRFNVFEAMGTVRQELRHSDFLAFVLDPSGTHGLGDYLLKKLLQRVLVAGAHQETFAVRSIDVHLWDMQGADVLREWKNIDILVRDEKNQVAVIIENKVDSQEHSNQLVRYVGRCLPRVPFGELYRL